MVLKNSISSSYAANYFIMINSSVKNIFVIRWFKKKLNYYNDFTK